jgi:hypothetical protein
MDVAAAQWLHAAIAFQRAHLGQDLLDQLARDPTVDEALQSP